MTPDDPFGRKGEEQTDAFGRPIEDRGSGSLWSGPAESERVEEPARTEAPPRFLPPTDTPAEQGDWWAQSGSGTSPATSPTNDAGLASYGERVGAALIDFLVRAVIVIVVTLAFAASGSEDAAAVGVLIGIYLIAPMYAPLAMTRWDGQTLGHRAVSTRIVNRGGAPVRGGKAFTREFLVKNVLIEGIGGLLTLGIFTLVNYLWPLWDERNEALHDKMCDTRVVKA